MSRASRRARICDLYAHAVAAASPPFCTSWQAGGLTWFGDRRERPLALPAFRVGSDAEAPGLGSFLLGRPLTRDDSDLDASLGIPEGLTEVIGTRLAPLSQPGRRPSGYRSEASGEVVGELPATGTSDSPICAVRIPPLNDG
jgi:hypothetical protein